MKRTSIFLIAMLSLGVANANQDVAKVTGVSQSYRMVQVPYQECRMVQVPVQVTYPGEGRVRTVKRQSGADKLLGMAAAGYLGSSIGSGDGKKAATALGALAGYGLLGDKEEVIDNRGQTVTEYRDVEKCGTQFRSESVPDGYVIRFDYNGITGSTKRSTPLNVGDDIVVNVSVTAR